MFAVVLELAKGNFQMCFRNKFIICTDRRYFMNYMLKEFGFTMIRPGEMENIWSRELNIVFILKGNGWLYMEGADTDYTVGEGDIFVINSFQMHSMELEKDALAIALRISSSFLAEISPDTKKIYINCKSFLHGQGEQKPFDRLRRDFAAAFRAQYKNESRNSIHLRSKIVILSDHLLENFLEEGTEPRSKSGGERLRAAVEYIQHHYQENITLKDLSNHTYLSTSYISRSFPKYLGISFTGYLTRVRLLHGAALLRGNGTITEIAYRCGFPSANAFIDAFRQYHGITPGQYRRRIPENLEKEGEKDASSNFQPEEFSTAFASLMKYTEETHQESLSPIASVCEVKANISSVKGQLKNNWKLLINAGYARDVLDGSIQKQIERLQMTIGFSYIRCKGILDDDMMVYTKDVSGKAAVNFVYVDAVIDFILSIHGKPMLELGHMPSAMAKRREQPFQRPAVISPPGDILLWQHLIGELMEHFIGRYGLEEVKQWLFAPWVGSDLSAFGFFTKEEYGIVYKASYYAIKNACRDFKICGPGTSIYSLEAVKDFLKMCRDNDCLPDILALRSFGAVNPGDEKDGLKLQESSEAFYVAVSGDEAYLTNCLKKLRPAVEKEEAGHLPVMLEEWSNNVWQRDLCNDTSYKSAYLFKSILDNWDSFYGMGYYSIEDQLDEIAPAPELFHGGFGLFLRNGIPKSAYRAMELLNRAGDTLVERGEGFFITKSDRQVQIFLYNYCHYDLLYRYRNTAHLTRTQRYKVFNEKPACSFHIRLLGLLPGKHKVTRYSVGPEGGSTFDAWLSMGAPGQLTKEEEKMLDHLSFPLYHTEIKTVKEILEMKTCLLPHEIQLITITRQK